MHRVVVRAARVKRSEVTIDEATSLRDVAGAVAATLRGIDHDPVVVGGSAATIHAPEAYRSRDIDVVVIGGIDDAAVIERMASIGYVLRSGMFIHERSPYTIDFVPSPVAIRGDVISNFARVQTAYGCLRVLDPTDVVCDRLNKYVAYEDPDAFEVAVAVARLKAVDMQRVGAFIERQSVGVFAQGFQAGLARLVRRLGAGTREVSRIGFATAVRVRFANVPDDDTAEITARGILALLDEDRREIDPVIDGVIVRSPSARRSEEEADLITVFVWIATTRDLAPVDRFALADATVTHLRSRLAMFPELVDVPDVGTPPVTTIG